MNWDVILGISSSVGLFHALFLAGCLALSKKGNRKANLLLVFILLAFSIRIFKSTFFAVAGAIPDYLPLLGLLGMSFNGPLLLFYFRHLKREPVPAATKAAHLFLPVVTSSAFFIQGEPYLRALYLIVIAAQLCYIAYVFVMANQWGDRPSRKWMLDLTTAFLVIEVVYFLQWTGLDSMAYVVATCVSSVVLLLLTYAAFLKHDVFRKIHHQRLDEPEARDDIGSALRKIIVEEQGFRDSKLSVKSLADVFSVSPSRISVAVQREFGKSFPDFINELRLDYVKHQLQQEIPHEKVESLAFDAGYQSPSSFYAHFKKAFKMTPSEFRNRRRTDVLQS